MDCFGEKKICHKFVKSEAKKRDTLKNWPLIKNPQFLSNPHETLGQRSLVFQESLSQNFIKNTKVL